MKLKKSVLCLTMLALLLPVLCACKKEEAEPKKRDVDFTLVPEDDLPDALASIIESKKSGDMMLTYATDNELYIVRGYGTRPTNGFDIQVTDCYLTDSNIVFTTKLSGPAEDENTTSLPSYPFVVIKTAYLDEPVKFQNQ